MHRSPKLILVAVRIGNIDDRALVTLGGCPYRVRVRDLVLIEPAQVRVDVFRPDKVVERNLILARIQRIRIDLTEVKSVVSAVVFHRSSRY